MASLPPETWIIIPALNAEKTLPAVLTEIREICGPIPVVVVNDGSCDGTEAAGRRYGATVLRHPANRGCGASIKTGVAFALDHGAHAFLTLGADHQRDARDILGLVQTFSGSGCDVVIGSKFLGGKQPMPALRRTGNRLANRVFNALFGSRFTDVTSGFRIFNGKVARDLAGLDDRYPFDADLCALILRRGWRWQEIPVKVRYDTESSRMKNALLVGLQILTAMIRRKFQRP